MAVQPPEHFRRHERFLGGINPSPGYGQTGREVEMPEILAGDEKAVDNIRYQRGLQPNAQGSGVQVLASADRPRLPFDRGQSEQWGQNNDQIGEQSDGGQFSGYLEICVVRDLVPFILTRRLVGRLNVKITHTEADYRMPDGQVNAAFQQLASSLSRNLGAAVLIENRSEADVIGAGEIADQDDGRHQADERGPGTLAAPEFPDHYR